MTGLASLLILAAGLNFGFAHNFQPPRGERDARAEIPTLHHHAKGEDVMKEIAPEVKIVEASVPENAELQNLLLNKSRDKEEHNENPNEFDWGCSTFCFD